MALVPESAPEKAATRTTKERASNRSVAAQADFNPPKPDPANPDAVNLLSVEATKADVSNRPAAGQTHLEFSAPSPQTAEIILDALHEKGFEAIVSEIKESTGTFRVLLKLLNDTSIAQPHADLERAGFHGNAAILRIVK